MSAGLPLRTRALVALIFGTAGALSIVLVGVVVAVLSADTIGDVAAYGWDVVTGEEATFAVVTLTAAASGAACGAWRADRLLCRPHSPGGVLPTAAVRGMGVALAGYLVGAVAVPIALWGVALVVDGPTPVIGVPFMVLAALVLGSFTVLPAALLVGGLAGWIVGRTLGTGVGAGR